MAAKAEQIPATSTIAAPAPCDAPDPVPDLPRDSAASADGKVPIEWAVTAGRAADGEVLLPEGDLRVDSPSPVVPSQEDDGAKGEPKSTPDREEEGEEEGAEGGERGGGGGKRGEMKGSLFLPDAKRHKACPAALENLPTPPAAEELGAGGGGGREGAPGTGESSSSSSPPSFSFSFSFDTRGFGAPPIETTPKFGSFNFAAISSAASGAEALGAAAAAAGGGDEARGQEAEGGAL